MREPLCAALAVLVTLAVSTSRSFAAPASGSDPADSTSHGVIAAAETTPASSAGAADDLGPTTDPPWNPPHAMTARRTWERVLLAPGFVASIPFYALGMGLDMTMKYVEDRAVVQQALAAARAIPQAGFGLQVASLGDRTGLGAKLATRAPFFGGAFRNKVFIAHSASLLHYHLTEVRLLGDPLGIEYQYGWRPRDQFFGVGMETSKDSVSTLASQNELVRLTLSHSWNSDDPKGMPRTFVGAWIGPRTQTTARGRESGRPSIEERFPGLVANTFDRRIDHLVYGGRISSDWRVGKPHWAQGWRTLMEVERFDRPVQALALRSGRPTGAVFTRTTVEIESGFSFLRDPRTVRFMGRLVDQDVSSGADRFMVEDLASLGGREGLGGFEPGRFRDLDQVLGRVTYVFPLVRRFEMDLHVETGGVFSDVWKKASIGGLEESFGLALRARMDQRPVGAIGVDFSRESIRVRYALGRVD